MLLVLVLLAGGVVATTGQPASGQTPPRCDEPQRVQAFDSAGKPVSASGNGCTLRTGFLTGESHLRVAPDGTVIQQPAQTVPGFAGTGFFGGAPGPRPQTQLSPAGFAVSRNQGQRFEMVLPSGQQWVASDGAIHIDSATGRLYYYALSPSSVPQGGSVPLQDNVPAGYAHLMTSPDNGRTWHHTQAPGYVESENPRFTSGPTPAKGDKPIPGERIAYWCGNTILFAFGQRDCYRTLDGGQTWVFRSTLLRRATPIHPECGRNEESFDFSDGNYPTVGPDGTLWTLVTCGGTSFLARSTDQGLTFPVLTDKGKPLTTPGLEELRIDSTGILYGAAVSGTTLLLRTSRDGGRTWSAPVDLIAPALRGAPLGQWALAVRGPGQVAVAYLTARAAGGFNGNVTLTRNALAKRPVFTTSTVHNGIKPLVTSPQTAKDDYIDLDIGPDGVAWAAFYGDCGTDPACATSAQNPMAKISVLTRLG